MEDADILVSVTDNSGKIVYVNKRFCEVSEFTEDEVIGNTHRILKSGHHPREFYKNLWETITHGNVWSGMIKNKTKKGERYWVKSIMCPVFFGKKEDVKFVCLSYKIDKQKEDNILKLRNLENIQHALDQASIVAMTDQYGDITYVNKKFCDISKYTEDELIGKNHRILKSNFHSVEFYADMWKSITSGKIWHGDIKNKAKDGTFYWVKTTIVPIFNNEGKIQQYIAIRTDISEQKQFTETEITKEKFEVIGKISSRIAHDVRNPLSIIRASVENIKILYGVDGVKIENMDKIDRAIERIVYQMDNVLDFIRREPGEFEICHLSEILDESLDSIRIPSGVEIDIPKNDIRILCDKRQLSIALANIIVNAIQAMNENGNIKIRFKDANDEVRIEIEDSGPGIPEEIIDKIFEPLFTTKQKGTGLGLSSVKSIIESHCGSICVKSPPTIFTILLPKNICS